HSRERVVSIQPQGRGFLLTTLRYANEVRTPDQYFADVKSDAVNDEQLALAKNIIESRRGSFDPAAFTDAYRDAFFEMIKTKVAGHKPVIVEDEQAPTAFNFMDALRESVAQAGGKTAKRKAKAPSKKKTTKKAKKPAAKSVSKKKPATKKKRA
ncbi:MAG: Ku protein, partial [Planctomycetota bacterium]